MNKVITGFIMAILVVGCQFAPANNPTIKYDVDFSNAEHNEAHITMTVENLSPGPVRVAMSRTSPGRYALHEFVKNVYNVYALDENGDTLKIDQPDLHNWSITDHDGTVQFNYTLYGDHADGTYTGINEKHAHLNMPATFVWMPRLRDSKIEVKFHPPENSNWKVATQLQKTEETMTYFAPDVEYFLDSPTELSDFTLSQWKVSDDTTDQVIRMAVHHNGDEEQVDAYVDMAQKVVAEQIAIFDGPAKFDYGEYTFIADYLPYVFGDGMEHRNSTILTSRRSLKGENALKNLYTLSHEFFHSWNVERLRPDDLEPFHFMDANVSEALWFAEGFTSYYDDLTIRRAGLTDDKKYAADWEGTLNYVLNSPGNTFYNPKEMSMQAPFVDAATSVDAQNKSNTFISYYSWGSVLGLGLDLSLRTHFEELSLDDYMRLLWNKYGKSENPYTIDDLRLMLAELTDSTAFANEFFARHIDQGEHPDLKSLLAKAGFSLQKANPGRAVLQFGSQKINYEGGVAKITENTLIGSPLYKAGLDRGDTISKLGGESIQNAKDVQQVLASHQPGDKISITFTSLGDTKERSIKLSEDPALELVPFELTDQEFTDEMKEFREQWLGSKAE